MQHCSKQSYAHLYAVLLALCLVLAALQSAFAHHSSTPAPSAMQADIHSQHGDNSQTTVSCDTDCAGTVYHCCLYALCTSQPLMFPSPSVAQHSLLPSLFSSRAIAPLTKPPKSTSS